MPRTLSAMRSRVPEPVNQVLEDFAIIGEGIKIPVLSADPVPATGYGYIWISDGTGTGDAGDLMVALNPAGTVETATLVDFSGL